MDQPTQAGSADRSLKGRFKRLGNALLEALFPETFVCFGCGAELNGAVLPLCEACIAALPVRQGEFCPLCGATVAKKGELCRHCAQQKPHFDSVNAPYFYEGVSRKAVLSFKDGDQRWLGKYLCKEMVACYRKSGIEGDAVVSVPSGRKAIRRRGFDHAEALGRAVANDLQLPYYNVLARVAESADSTKLDRGGRYAAVFGAFDVAEGETVKEIAGKKIVLIDDVVTTGATADEVAKILKLNGAARVDVLAFIRR